MLQLIYTISGIVAVITGIYSLNDQPRRFGSAFFWIIFGSIFIFGSMVPSYIIGLAILIMGILSLFKQLVPTAITDSSEEFKQEKSQQLGYKIWIPTLGLGIIAMLLSSLNVFNGLVSIGIAAVVVLLILSFFVKESPIKGVSLDGPRLLQNMGAMVVLPQLLGSLGALFAAAGVGTTIAQLMSKLVLPGNPLIGSALYCVSIALFTVIMGNAFAAFAVITAGIGVPFVIEIGGNPLFVSALGMTAGYCGTLMTPMAANFNILPAAIMQIEDKYSIIKYQLPIGVVLLLIHIALMYFLAF